MEKLKRGEVVNGLRLYIGRVESGTLNNGHIIFKQSNTHIDCVTSTETKTNLHIVNNYYNGQTEYRYEYVPELKTTYKNSIDYECSHVSPFDLKLDNGDTIVVNPNEKTEFLHTITDEERKNIMIKAGRLHKSNLDSNHRNFFTDISFTMAKNSNKQHYFVLNRNDEVYVVMKNNKCVAISKEIEEINLFVIYNTLTLIDILMLFLMTIFFPITLIYAIFSCFSQKKVKLYNQDIHGPIA